MILIKSTTKVRHNGKVQWNGSVGPPTLQAVRKNKQYVEGSLDPRRDQLITLVNKQEDKAPVSVELRLPARQIAVRSAVWKVLYQSGRPPEVVFVGLEGLRGELPGVIFQQA